MINDIETKKKFGYTKEELPTNSLKKVVWFCDHCGKNEIISYQVAYKRYKKSLDKNREGKELCNECSFSLKEQKNSKSIEIINLIDQEKNLLKYGYNPINLSPWSRKKIDIICNCCKKEIATTRSNININKSIIENGFFSCKSCSSKNSRNGKKHKEETKKRISKSLKFKNV